MTKTILTTFFLLITLLTSGRSSVRYRPADDVDRSMGRWRYTVRVSARGTRSEGTTGRLYWNGRQIPSRFHEIHINMGKFLFFEGRYRWGAHGWKLQNRTPADGLPQVKAVIRQSAKTRGWYSGRLQRIYTPKSWVRVRRGSEYYWVAPSRLAELARIKGWSWLRAHPYDHLMKQSPNPAGE